MMRNVKMLLATLLLVVASYSTATAQVYTYLNARGEEVYYGYELTAQQAQALGLKRYERTGITSPSKPSEKDRTANQNAGTDKRPANAVIRDSSFEFDGFYWNILGVYKVGALGRPSDLQHPSNDYYLIIEAELKNISNEPRYYGNFVLLAGDQQYENSSTVCVYGKYFFGYECKHLTMYESGSRLRTYFGFDVKSAREYTMILKSFGGARTREQVEISILD